MSLNRRSDNGENIFRLEADNIDYSEGQDIPVRRTNHRKISSGQYSSDDQSLTKEDKVTRIKACATMWHENSEEMCEMLKSIFRMDEDYCAR